MWGQRPPWLPTDAAGLHDSPRPTKRPRTRSNRMKDWLRQLATPTTAPGSTHDSHLSSSEPTHRLFTERVQVSKRNEAHSEGSDDRRSGSPGPISYIVVDADYSALGKAPDSSGTATPVGINSSTSPRTRHSMEGRTGTYSTQGSAAFRAPSIGSWAWFKLIFQLRVWPALVYFANPRFLDQKKETLYRKEAWYSEKFGAVFSSFLLLINWISFCSLLKKPTKFQLWVRNQAVDGADRQSYTLLCGIPALPLLPMLLLNWPIRRNCMMRYSYQICLLVAVWSWSFLLAVDMKFCNFGQPGSTCDDRKIIAQAGYVVGLPTISILFMRQNRFLHLLCTLGASVCWLVTSNELNGQIPLEYWRTPIGCESVAEGDNLTTVVIYHTFLIGLDFLRERSGRQLFELREELKSQYRAVQSAQVMERKAEQSKERFVSYIFHEVRVPLNTALLAVQNLRGEGVFHNLNEDKSDMVHGLSSSLSLMENVLDDVLSFNRMESGMFVLTNRPFDFQKAMQLIALAHRLQAQSAGIDLLFNWDPRISALPLLLGDEMRLRQVASNLVSNAIKFTPKGSVTITTSIVRSVPPMATAIAPEGLEETDAKAFIKDLEKGDVEVEAVRMSLGSQPGETSTAMSSEPSYGGCKIVDDELSQPESDKWVVLRVEVADTGVGIKEEDMEEGHLFSPYSQSEVGRRQGGKGSGLGLALVRQIVQLSGGRLGVDSQV
ncbi:Histidine kinase 2 [Vanrija pseudolonga]|uniref:histidine kinase n=1 Tax=Vanrija pseudolonga TaxID=143232 RepID=A0AAF1BKR1_9TREE|nr:Histidine kinase 2 [Vanrija pseudolonga]